MEKMKIRGGTDPGASGGVAWQEDGKPASALFTAKLPPTMTEIVDFFRKLSEDYEIVNMHLEDVGVHMQGNNASSSAKFAKSCGWVEAALYALGIPTTMVAPKKWQACLGGLPPKGPARKAKIKELMQRHYPGTKLILPTADATGILYYATTCDNRPECRGKTVLGEDVGEAADA